jgi:hypothetical protein
LGQYARRYQRLPMLVQESGSIANPALVITLVSTTTAESADVQDQTERKG